jgi:hypothetical protein
MVIRILKIVTFMLIVGTTFFIGARQGSNCKFPFCQNYGNQIDYLFNFYLYNEDPKNLYSGDFKLTQTVQTNNKSGLVKWFELPLDEESRYGGLAYSEKDNKFIYLSQLGSFFNVSTGGEIALNERIPSIKFKPIQEAYQYFHEYRLGVRDLYFDNKDKSFSVAASEFDYENNCHYVTVYFLESINHKWKKIFHSQCWSFGSSIQIGAAVVKDGRNIFLTLGDNQIAEPEMGIMNQDQSYDKKLNLLDEQGVGKIIKINLDTKKAEIFANGFRNPQGITFSNNKNLFTIGHGPQGGDELNIITEGSHYGHPVMTFGVSYGEKEYMHYNDQNFKAFRPPIYSFSPSVAPSDILFNKSYKPLGNTSDCEFVLTTLKQESLVFMRLNNGCSNVQNIELLDLDRRLRKIASDGKEVPTFAFTSDNENLIGLLKLN